MEEYLFDAFIIFANEDFNWVRHHFLPEIESNAGMKACVHHRDFVPGRPIIDNIGEAFEISRKAIVVMSNNFLKSSWCMFEFDMAYAISVTRGYRSIVVVLMEELKRHKITREVCHILNTNTYLEWTDDENAQLVFWQNLAKALNHKCRK